MTALASYLKTLWATTWAENSVPGKLIVLLILVLLVRSWLHGRRNLKRYGRENVNLSKVISLLTQLQAAPPQEASASTETEGAAESRRPLPVPVERLKEGIDPATLIFDRLSAIEKLREHQVKVNVSALQQMSLARDAAQPGMATPGFNSGMAMLLGLLGTFLGLAVMAQQIQFALPGGSADIAIDSWSRAVEDVRSVLSGIKTAFSTSLVGMVCAMVSTVLSFRIRQEHNAFFEKLERFTTEDLLPATVPVVEDETLLEQVTRQLSESFDEIQTVSRQNREALQEMTAAEAAFADIVEEIRKITKSEASRDLESVISQLVATNRSVLQLVEQVPALARAFEHRSERLLEKIAEPRFVPTPPSTRSAFSVSGALGLLAALAFVYWLLQTIAG